MLKKEVFTSTRSHVVVRDTNKERRERRVVVYTSAIEIS